LLDSHRLLKEKTLKKISIVSAALLSLIVPFAAQMTFAATQSFEGVVSDSMCGKTHMMPGKTAAQCVAECIKAGSGYVLVTDNKVYKLTAKPGTLAQFAGKHVQVQGEASETTITVTTIR
jgi:hypothetical protein